MAIQEIIEIKKAEEEAFEIIKAAENERRAILKSAQNQALEKYDETLKEIKSKAKSIVDEAISLAEKEAYTISINGKNEISSIYNIPKERLDNAVKLIIERIVKNYGNS